MPETAAKFALFDSFEERLRYPPERDGFVSLSRQGHQHPMHRHRELEFNLVVRGTARYLLGDRRYEMRPHSLVWLFPEQDHVLLDKSPDFAQWIVVFRPDLVARTCRAPESSPLGAPNPAGYFCRRLPAHDAQMLEALLTQITIGGESHDRFNAGLGYALALAWDAFCRADGDTTGADDVHPAVERAVHLLRSPDGDALSLSQIAARCQLSDAHLSRLFRAQIGLAPVVFRNRERVRRFMDAYGRGQRMTLLDAALSAGFGSYTQFHRVFTDIMGVSPSEYRRRLNRGEGV